MDICAVLPQHLLNETRVLEQFYKTCDSRSQIGMGCMTSSQRVDVTSPNQNISSRQNESGKGDTLVSVLSRLDEEIASSEKSYPAERLAVVTAELESIKQEIKEFNETSILQISTDTYAKTLHQIFVSLDLYNRPMLASENEDFIANVNRKEMRRIELMWLCTRQRELQREQRILHAQLLRTRSLYKQLQQLLDSVWRGSRPGTDIEGALGRAHALRAALASVGARLGAAVEYVRTALRLLDDALPAWKLASVGKSGWERTAACAEACHVLIRARCSERGARRVLAAPAAPRAARALRLALDYAFTDAMHDHKYQRATETFIQFKEALVQLVNTIHQTNDVNVFINGKAISVPSYFTILQALRRERVTIPTFCYHDRLSIAGNCRMCLVQVEGMWKPQIACAMPVSKGMKIRTNSSVTRQAQEGVLEFILADHPLDCPICDQGGECDLQDLSMRFGSDRTRFTDIHFEGKRAAENKNLGPLIRTEMTRCIHCTRCIRFASQVCGLDVLGTSGRGTDMLVGTYVDKKFLSELSGNIIDLCPVGALTAIPYRFKARPWEVRRTNSIDVTDATGTNIVLNYRFDRVLRVLPRENDEVNQEWLSDKGRWAIDSLEMQRLVTPMYRKGDCLCPVEWDCALKMTSNLINSTNPCKIMAIAGPYCNVETLVAAKDFLNMLGSDHTYIERGLTYTKSDIDIRAAYSLNINMKDIAKADKILLVGTHPRFEAPVLNAWIRQAYMFNECDIYFIGPKCEFNYYVNYLGQDASAVCKAGEVLKGAKKPLILVGVSLLDTPNGGPIMCALTNLAACFKGDPEWTVLNVLTREASFAGALEGGWKPGASDAIKMYGPSILISLGADDIFYDWNPPPGCTVIYIGFQGDRGSECASIILPGSAYSESGGVFLNVECRSQYALPAVTPPGKARHDWKIIRALAEYCGICLFYSDANSLCWRLGQVSPNFVNFGQYQKKLFSELIAPFIDTSQKVTGTLDVDMKTLKDYYCSDTFTYNSPTMVKAQKVAAEFATSCYSVV